MPLSIKLSYFQIKILINCDVIGLIMTGQSTYKSVDLSKYKIISRCNSVVSCLHYKLDVCETCLVCRGWSTVSVTGSGSGSVGRFLYKSAIFCPEYQFVCKMWSVWRVRSVLQCQYNYSINITVMF